MPRVRLTGPAQRDLDDLVVWWAENQSEDHAVTLYKRLRLAIAALERMPESHGLAPESSRFDIAVRQLLFRTGNRASYRVLFETQNEEVRVLRGRHVAQRSLTIDDLQR